LVTKLDEFGFQLSKNWITELPATDYKTSRNTFYNGQQYKSNRIYSELKLYDNKFSGVYFDS